MSTPPNITELIKELQNWEKKYGEWKTGTLPPDGKGDEFCSYIVSQHPWDDNNETDLTGPMKETDAEFIVKLRNAFPSIAAAFLANEERVRDYEAALEYVQEACLCKRFKTKGFDYNEKHPKMGDAGAGQRWFTPSDKAASILRLHRPTPLP